MNRVTEIVGDYIEITADPGILHPGRLYVVDRDATLEEGDVVSVEEVAVGAVLAIDVLFGTKMRRYGFTHGSTLKVTPQMMEQLGFSEVYDEEIGGE